MRKKQKHHQYLQALKKPPSKTLMFCQKNHANPICNNSIKKKNNVMRAKIIQRATTLTAAMQYTIFAQLT